MRIPYWSGPPDCPGLQLSASSGRLRLRFAARQCRIGTHAPASFARLRSRLLRVRADALHRGVPGRNSTARLQEKALQPSHYEFDEEQLSMRIEIARSTSKNKEAAECCEPKHVAASDCRGGPNYCLIFSTSESFASPPRQRREVRHGS